MKRPIAHTLETIMIIALAVAGLAAPVHAESDIRPGDIPYTLYYSAPGANNIPAPATFNGYEDIAIAEVTSSTPYLDGYTFTGWSWTDDGTPDFYPSDHITLTARETTVYATWQPAGELATSDIPLVDSDDAGFIDASETTDPLGRSSASQSTPTYSVYACVVIALGALMSAGFVVFGLYTLLDLKQAMDK